ncbi:MAG: DUF2071 domain-containing protein [Bacteroidia bacterium]
MTTFLKANWENIIMANYVVPPHVLYPYLPNGVALDLYQGNAYVSLVGFIFKNTKLFQIPIPWLGTFEEINLRFYVTRKVGNETKRGVVFINETVPYKIVAWLANKLYKEHYTVISTQHNWNINSQVKRISYRWLLNNNWNDIYVDALTEKTPIINGSFEEFIFEHYYGYTKINNTTTEEYRINHPRWMINKVNGYATNCDFSNMYGNDFQFLSKTTPASVFLAEGSAVEVKWKRTRF